MTAEVLSFRVDANLASGMGHAMRCLALAQAWKDQAHRPVFLMAESMPPIDARLTQESIEVVKVAAEPGTEKDAQNSITASRKAESQWIVLDGYQFDAAYQEVLKDVGFSVLAIDDFGHAGRYPADIVVNQNLHARASLYRKRIPTTRLLLGPRYALLRREFRRARPREEPRSRVEEILVTLGGVDRPEVVGRILRGLARVERGTLKVTIVPGMRETPGIDLARLARELHLQAVVSGDVQDMPGLMARADMAIAAGGTTAWELAYLGVPSLLTVLAENQRGVVESLARKGVARSLGPVTELTPGRVAETVRSLIDDPGTREEMAKRGRELVDGGGVDRVLRELSLDPFVLRPAHEEDMRQVWEWANEPGTRAASFSENPIPWEDHVKWFRSKLSDPNSRFYLASLQDGRSIGQIRFDVGGEDSEISVSLDTGFRHKGYGAAIIRAASQKFLDETDVRTVHAYLKEANETSARAFMDGGFGDRGITTIRGHRARHFVLESEEAA